MGGHGSGRKPFKAFIPQRTEIISIGDGVPLELPNLGAAGKNPVVIEDIKKIDYGTQGSVLFLDANGKITEDNTNLFWDDANNRLGIGKATPDQPLDIIGKMKISQTDGGTIGTIIFGNTDGRSISLNSAEVQVGVTLSKFRFTRNGVTTFEASGLDGTSPVLRFNSFREQTSGNIVAFANALSDKVTISFDGKLDTQGFSTNLTSQTGTYTALTSDHTIECGAGNESFTVNLPAAAGVTGIIYCIVNVGTGIITIDGNGSETINGETTQTINSQWDNLTIQSNGSNWITIH